MKKRIFLKDFDWSAVQCDYDAGLSWRGIIEKYKTTPTSLNKAAKLGLFKTRTQIEGATISRNAIPREMSAESRAAQSRRAKDRGLGGKRNSHKFEYNGVILDSSYELEMAKNLDAAGVTWERPGRFKWIDDDGVDHHYTPDFYLPHYNVYLDPKHKGIIPLHARKIELVQKQNGIKVLVLTKEQLTWQAVLLYIE